MGLKLALVNVDKISVDPPLGIAYIASYLRKYGFNNIVIIDKEDELKRIKKEKPDIVGITSSTSEFNNAVKLAEKIKEIFGMPLIVGGAHISSLPIHLLKTNFDVAVLGEGEQTMLELVRCYERYGSFDKVYISKINGLAFESNGDLKFTEKRKLIENLDTIPYPARDLLRMKKYYLLPRGSFFPGEFAVTTGILTSRGCPYNCSFCSSSKFWMRKIRFHSAKYVVEEIKEIVEKYKVDHISIWDDLFTANKKRMAEIVRLIKMEKIDKMVQFVGNGRSNLIDRETCKLMKEMNVTRLSIGLESGSQKILKYLKGDSVSVKDNFRAIKLCKEFKIKTNGFIIIGSPTETDKDMKETLKLVKDPNLDTASVFQLAPFPNTEVWEYAKEKGIVSEDIIFDYSQLSIPEFKPNLIMTENISREEFKKWYNKFQEEAGKKFYTGIKFKPKYFKYVLSPRFLLRALMHWKRTLNYMGFRKIIGD